ncbi:hypothetical protein NA57DRAFT_69502 [Rhizodiscina lignyota]|uniref:Tail specific protease domain-containing protein n=1 Tax=Rhizodiscina lignyota TaxID=1504668 RepID=A0A9P4I0V8_9PEZI|nr:hypothetical protein NA57DRAFT_69502 [Rhizodiscina lignyota]
MASFRFSLLVCWASWASLAISSPYPFSNGRLAPTQVQPSTALPSVSTLTPVPLVDSAAAPKSESPSAQVTSAAPLPSNYMEEQPCAVVSAMVAPQLLLSTLPVVPAQMAWDCLQSVPLNKSAALDLMDAIKPFLEWQTTTAYLKNPPAEYVKKIQEPTDVMGNVQKIIENLNNDEYANEFAFGWDLFQVTAQTHDGHFAFIPDSVGSIFSWARTVPLVSISEDGEKLPVPFAYEDVLEASLANSTYDPSPIIRINDQDATEFLENLSQTGNLQDRDALYNNMFVELAQISLGGNGAGRGMFAGGGRGRFIYPGLDTVLEFANGTSMRYSNIAKVLTTFIDVTDGRSLYQEYFVPLIPNPTVDLINNPTSEPTLSFSFTSSKATSTPTPVPAPGFPKPIFRFSENFNGGYYLNGEGYEDIAVLNIAGFQGGDTVAQDQEFQNVNTNFLQKAKADGKTKLIIDLSANGGGTVMQGYDMFKQLFPELELYGATRFRAHEAANIIGDIFSVAAAPFPRRPNPLDLNIVAVIASPFNFRSDIGEEGDPFAHWDTGSAQKYDERSYNNDSFTGIIRWDLSDPLIELTSGGINVTGYGNRTSFMQPFAAEDIVMVYDGYCASTCALFSEMVRQQAGVKTIAFGGRSNKNIIQAVGGVKGANVYTWSAIQTMAESAFNYSSPEDGQQMKNTELGRYTSFLPFYRAANYPTVNSRDALRQGDTSGTPLQFRYEPADCRIFYTAEMTFDIAASWKAAADSMWGKKNWMPTSMARNGERTVEEMSTKLVVERTLGVEQYESLKKGMEVWTDQVSRFKEAQGLMVP